MAKHIRFTPTDYFHTGSLTKTIEIVVIIVPVERMRNSKRGITVSLSKTHPDLHWSHTKAEQGRSAKRAFCPSPPSSQLHVPGNTAHWENHEFLVTMME